MTNASDNSARPKRRWVAPAVVLLCAAVAVCVIVVSIAQRAAGGDAILTAWKSSQFRLFASVAGVSALLLATCGGVLWRVGRRRIERMGRPDAESGTAILEFAMVLPFAMMISLLMVQSSLLMGGYLCVNYASYCAARSAIVYIPQEMRDEPRNQLLDYERHSESDKLWRVHRAAVWAVMSTGDGSYERESDYTDVLTEGVEGIYAAYGKSAPNWAGSYIGKKMAYAEDNTTIEVTPPMVEDTYGEHEDITVVVTHNLYLSVPYANRVLALLDEENSIDLGDGKYATRVTIPCTLTNEGVQDFIQVEDFPN